MPALCNALCGVLVIFVISVNLAGPSSAAPVDSVVCDDLTGAAKGLCAAAVSVGCGDIYEQPPGCKQIETNFKELTDSTPPWVPSDCPCGTQLEVEGAINDWVDAGNVITGGRVEGSYVVVRAPHCQILFGSTYPDFLPIPDVVEEPQCGKVNGELVFGISNYQAESCVYLTLSAINATGIPLVDDEVPPLCDAVR